MMQSTAIPSGWQQRRLRFDIKSNPKKAELDLDDETEISFVSMDAVGELGGLRLDTTRALVDVYKDYTYFADGDVCIARITPCFENGKGALATGLTEGVGFGTTELHVLRPKDELDRKFLFYITISHDFRGYGEAEMLGAGGQKRVPERFIKDWRAPLPDLDTQRRIAAYLDDKTARIDALIDKKRALLDRLAEKRQAIITRGVTRGLNPDAPLKDSGIDWLGKVPAHWEVKPLKFVGSVLQGMTYSPEDVVEKGEGRLVIRASNIQDGRLVHADDVFVSFEAQPPNISQAGDIIICSRNGSRHLIGKCATVSGEWVGETFGAFMTSVRSEHGAWLSWVLASQIFEHQSGMFMSSTINQLTNSTLKNMVVPLPPASEQAAVSDWLVPRVERIYEAQDVVRASIEKLTEYRAAFVTAAVTGKIKALLAESAPKSAKKPANDAFKRSVLAAYIADTLCDHPTFGRVKFQKLLHLSEGYANANEVAGDYKRDAAGPFDTRMMQSVHSQIKKQGWIVTAKRDGDAGTLYRRGEKVEGYKTYFDRYFGDRKDDIDYLLALFKTATTQQAEIVSTTFAAWNDLLLEGNTPSDDEIVELILNDWHDSKRKIAPEQWHNALPWMREKGLVPRGMGEHTKKKGAQRGKQ